MARRSAGIALLVAVGGFIAIASACSNQGEGERCEIANGNDDCKTDEGLSCYPAGQLVDQTSDRCCPTDRSKATHPVCRTPVDIVGDAATPADTGPAPSGDASTADTGTQDASTEDASSDASDADAQ